MKAILPIAAIAVLCIAGLTAGSDQRRPLPDYTNRQIDAIIGAGAFNSVFPIAPGGTAAEQQARVTERLIKVENLLRQRDVSHLPEALQAERMRSLDRLHEYRLRGIYPRNAAYPNEQRPCFIDDDGRICAVGYLVEQTAGREVAEKINREYQYAAVAQMRSPLVESWIAGSGFTRAEIATIQEPGWMDEQRSIGIEPTIVTSTPASSEPARTSDTTAPATVLSDTSGATIARTVPADGTR